MYTTENQYHLHTQLWQLQLIDMNLCGHFDDGHVEEFGIGDNNNLEEHLLLDSAVVPEEMSTTTSGESVQPAGPFTYVDSSGFAGDLEKMKKTRAEEDQRRAEEDKQRRAEEDRQRCAEQEQRRAEEDQQRRAEEDRQRRAEQEQRRAEEDQRLCSSAAIGDHDVALCVRGSPPARN